MPEVYDYNQELADSWQPEVITLEDGTQVQRVPDSGEVGIYHGSPSVYNLMYLNAENRGCDSCHTDGLADLVENDLSLTHYKIDFGLGTVKNVSDCLRCHELAPETAPAHSFGNLMHGIHQGEKFNGDCMSCHMATADGTGMQLWDEEKYSILHGINAIANVEGNFSYDQDKLGGDSAGWTTHSETATVPEQNEVGPMSGGEPTDEMFDNWEISVTGMVDHPYTITMKEVLEEAPVEHFTSKLQCIINTVGGEEIGNFEVTGVPISWFLEKAGVQSDATGVIPHASDLYEWGYGYNLEDLAEDGGWIVWEINGERLSNIEGFPVRVWVPLNGASNSVRWVTELEVTDQEVYQDFGAYINDYIDEEGNHHYGGTVGDFGSGESDAVWGNKPSMAICNIHEGQIIPVGEEFVFEGYADALDEQVIAVEFSMDNGETWTRYDTSDSDKTKWVYWYFGFTPETEGAYVLSVRAISDVTGEPVYVDKVMVNAK
ncbi:molybdopterin-dependent oxidoreductase [Slackia heliotrinireducens]|nr:molybdopterin-dependent oxidoreductase [Slackia heliotrinireducens]